MQNPIAEALLDVFAVLQTPIAESPCSVTLLQEPKATEEKPEAQLQNPTADAACWVVLLQYPKAVEHAAVAQLYSPMAEA